MSLEKWLTEKGEEYAASGGDKYQNRYFEAAAELKAQRDTLAEMLADNGRLTNQCREWERAHTEQRERIEALERESQLRFDRMSFEAQGHAEYRVKFDDAEAARDKALADNEALTAMLTGGSNQILELQLTLEKIRKATMKEGQTVNGLTRDIRRAISDDQASKLPVRDLVAERDKALADVGKLREVLSDTLGRYAAEQIGWNSRTTPDWFVEYAGLAEGFGALKETSGEQDERG